MEVEYKKIVRKYKEFRCGSCTRLLGIIHNTGVLAIKYKEFKGYVLSGEFKIVCTFCGADNNYNHKSIIDV
jgi:hypothetical protein